VRQTAVEQEPKIELTQQMGNYLCKASSTSVSCQLRSSRYGANTSFGVLEMSEGSTQVVRMSYEYVIATAVTAP
jgi:hypothetical protein